MDGLMHDGGAYRQPIQPKQAESLSNKPDGDSISSEWMVKFHTGYKLDGND